MRKWIGLLPALALWNVLPAAQAQLGPGYGPRAGRPGRYDVRNPPLAPQPWMSTRLQGIYSDAQRVSLLGQGRLPLGPAAPISPLNRMLQAANVPPAVDPRLFENRPLAPVPNLGEFGPVHDAQNFDPLASLRGQGRPPLGSAAPTPPAGKVPPGIDLRLFENPPPIPAPNFGGFRAGPVAKRGDAQGPPGFGWELAAGILVVALVAGILYQLFRRDSRTG